MPRSPSVQFTDSSLALKPKRGTACLHCRRQKIKCDAHIQTPCSKCTEDTVECVIRPRANAAIVADDLRWQQTVETRLYELNHEIQQVKQKNRELEERYWSARTDQPVSMEIHPQTPQPELPQHLIKLAETIRSALEQLQKQSPLPAKLEDAVVLWEYFYDSLAIFHGFTASPELTTPSPLLFASIVTASSKRFPRDLTTKNSTWEELFQRALIKLLYEVRPKSWDDVVGVGIARTWFWKADEITAGLVYGCFVETTVPTESDVRSRRVWDFLEMTSVSHGILHLSTSTVPDRPPPGVPARTTPHLLLGALNELFDILGMVHRALTSAQSLVMAALKGTDGQGGLSYAEVLVLRNCRGDLDKWAPKWTEQIFNADMDRLPAGRNREFLLDLITLYQQVALVVVDGYLVQSPQSDSVQFTLSSRILISNATAKWSSSIHLWPKLFLHSTLIAALALPPMDPLSQQIHDLISPLSAVLQTTGRQLLQKLVEKLKIAPTASFASIISPSGNFDLNMAAYSGSDSFWDDLSGVLGLTNGGQNAEVSAHTSEWADISAWS